MERHHGHWLAFVLNYFLLSLLKLNCHLIPLHYVHLVYLQNMSAQSHDKLKLPKKNIKGQKILGWLAGFSLIKYWYHHLHLHLHTITSTNQKKMIMSVQVIQLIHITNLGIINIQTKNLEIWNLDIRFHRAEGPQFSNIPAWSFDWKVRS